MKTFKSLLNLQERKLLREEEDVEDVEKQEKVVKADVAELNVAEIDVKK